MVNGSYASEGATIAGRYIDMRGAPGTVTNFGTITAFVFLSDGGTVTNGGVGDTTALINGASGISIAGGAGAVSNFGTIQTFGFGASGVYLRGGGDVTNGAATDHAALIRGYTGVRINGGAGTVTNFGTIRGLGASGSKARLGPAAYQRRRDRPHGPDRGLYRRPHRRRPGR